MAANKVAAVGQSHLHSPPFFLPSSTAPLKRLSAWSMPSTFASLLFKAVFMASSSPAICSMLSSASCSMSIPRPMPSSLPSVTNPVMNTEVLLSKDKAPAFPSIFSDTCWAVLSFSSRESFSVVRESIAISMLLFSAMSPSITTSIFRSSLSASSLLFFSFSNCNLSRRTSAFSRSRSLKTASFSACRWAFLPVMSPLKSTSADRVDERSATCPCKVAISPSRLAFNSSTAFKPSIIFSSSVTCVIIALHLFASSVSFLWVDSLSRVACSKAFSRPSFSAATRSKRSFALLRASSTEPNFSSKAIFSCRMASLFETFPCRSAILV
ncbi:hypothetical protein C4D60_Mb08t06160 [Musa balbisiana]|uniref:Uncharacterized protein n=1 Tax=Musa balbisiana TaxID=52838 RepID=A0A4S8K1Q4_MUSBA|nr:hypothetical protein C4D60_Mb08t06160 [Musa balbisiana]